MFFLLAEEKLKFLTDKGSKYHHTKMPRLFRKSKTVKSWSGLEGEKAEVERLARIFYSAHAEKRASLQTSGMQTIRGPGGLGATITSADALIKIAESELALENLIDYCRVLIQEKKMDIVFLREEIDAMLGE